MEGGWRVRVREGEMKREKVFKVAGPVSQVETGGEQLTNLKEEHRRLTKIEKTRKELECLDALTAAPPLELDVADAQQALAAAKAAGVPCLGLPRRRVRENVPRWQESAGATCPLAPRRGSLFARQAHPTQGSRLQLRASTLL